METGGLGYLLIEIPASPLVPHMVNGRYYGRGDTTRHDLSDSEVRRLLERHHNRAERFEGALRTEVARDPCDEATRTQPHLFLLLQPTTQRHNMLRSALESNGLKFHDWATTKILKGRPAETLPWPQNRYNPDIGTSLSVATRARGIGLYSFGIGPNRSPRPNGSRPIDERTLLDVEIDSDGSVRLFCSAGRTEQSVNDAPPRRLVIDALVAGLLVRCIRTASEVSEASSYSGTWDLGIHITNLRGRQASSQVSGFSGIRVDYTEDDYDCVTEAGMADLRDTERKITEDLLEPLFWGLRVNSVDL